MRKPGNALNLHRIYVSSKRLTMSPALGDSVAITVRQPQSKTGHSPALAISLASTRLFRLASSNEMVGHVNAEKAVLPYATVTRLSERYIFTSTVPYSRTACQRHGAIGC